MTNILSNVGQDRLTEYAKQWQETQAKLGGLLQTKVKDAAMPIVGTKVSQNLVFGVSSGNWPVLVIGNAEAEHQWTGIGDFGSGAVNAIGDFLLLQEYDADNCSLEFHVKLFDRSKPNVRSVAYRRDTAGQWHRYSWIAYQMVLDDPKPDGDLEEDPDYETHIKNLNALHNEISTIIGTLKMGRCLEVQFSGSNAQRYEMNILGVLDMTIGEARQRRNEQRKISNVASALRHRSLRKEVGASPANAMIDGLSVDTIALPFTVQVTTASGLTYPKTIRNETDVKFLHDNADLVAAGKLAIHLVK